MKQDPTRFRAERTVLPLANEAEKRNLRLSQSTRNTGEHRIIVIQCNTVALACLLSVRLDAFYCLTETERSCTELRYCCSGAFALVGTTSRLPVPSKRVKGISPKAVGYCATHRCIHCLSTPVALNLSVQYSTILYSKIVGYLL